MKNSKLNYSHKPLDFYYFLFHASLGGFLEKIGPKYIKDSFPKKIDKYFFVQNLKKETQVDQFFDFAIYKDEKGNKVIAKFWQGKYKNLSYFTLKNEINAYSVINNASERLKDRKYKGQITSIEVPVLRYANEKDHSVIALFDYKENAVTADSENDKDKLNIFYSLIEFLNITGKEATVNEKKLISSRRPINLLLLYPLLLALALIRHPRLFFKYLKASVVYIKSARYLIRDSRSNLSHRDLKFKNILFENKKIYLIDLEYCVFIHPYYEIANSLQSYWGEDEYFKLMFNSVEAITKGDPKEDLIFRGLLAQAAIHALTDKYSFRKMKNLEKCLDYVWKGTNEQKN